MCSTKQRLGALLREEREMRGLTLRQAAERASLAPSTLSRWESGACLPRVPELEALLKMLGTGPELMHRILISLDAPRAVRAIRKYRDHLDVPTGGSLLRALRRQSGLTVTEVAKHLGVAASSVSRWESSSSHPSDEYLAPMLALLRATPEEQACLRTSGVAKIKVERPPFDAEHSAAEIQVLSDRIEQGDTEKIELRILQLQSLLWWCQEEPRAPELLRRTNVLYAQFLVSQARYDEAADVAMRVLESGEPYDREGIEAQRAMARSDVFRHRPVRPHMGLCTLQACLHSSPDLKSKVGVLADMSEFSALAERNVEAADYGRRAIEAAIQLGRPGLIERIRARVVASSPVAAIAG